MCCACNARSLRLPSPGTTYKRTKSAYEEKVVSRTLDCAISVNQYCMYCSTVDVVLSIGIPVRCRSFRRVRSASASSQVEKYTLIRFRCGQGDETPAGARRWWTACGGVRRASRACTSCQVSRAYSPSTTGTRPRGGCCSGTVPDAPCRTGRCRSGGSGWRRTRHFRLSSTRTRSPVGRRGAHLHHHISGIDTDRNARRPES